MGKTMQPRSPESGTRTRRIHLREIAGGGEQLHETLGEELRSARLRRGEELATVSGVLRIGKSYLAALEEGRANDLPGTAYGIGFVRAYAAYLGLDAGYCVEWFKREAGWRPEIAAKDAPPLRSFADCLPSGWTLMAVLVVAVVVYGGYELTRSIKLSPPAPVAPVPARIAELPATHATPTRRGVSRSTTAGARTVAPLPSSPTASSPPPSASTASTAPPPAATDPIPVTGETLGIHNQNVRVILHVRADTHLTVKGQTGMVYLNRDLHPGDAYRVPDLMGISLTVSDGGAVALVLDGRDMGPAGPTGQAVESLSLDPPAIVDRTGTKPPG